MAQAILIDSQRLPQRCLADTGVFLRALRYEVDAATSVCCAFFESMFIADKEILLAAPVLVEVLRGGPNRTVPDTRNIIPVVFDVEAAKICGQELPVHVLRQYLNPSGVPHTYLKYDAMIVACAKRWQAECIVAIDPDHHKLAKHLGIPVYHPDYFRA